MATTAPETDQPLDIREQIARIDKTIAEVTKIKVDTRLAPFTLMATTAGATAALIGAGAAIAKLLMG